MRYSDIIKLTKENIVGNSIVYVSQKTKIKAEIPLSGVAYRFIDDLEFVNRTICKNTANSTIRRICKSCGIDQNIKLFRYGTDQEGEKWNFIAFHSARRSFATNLYLRGTDLYSISKLMGHADIQMTVHYIVCPPRISDKALEYFKQFE
jgi:integrase